VLLFFALACLFLLSSNPAFLGVAFVIGLGLCLISGMNVRHIGIRLAGPAFVALGLVAVRVWLSPENGGIADGTVLAGRVLAICTWAMPLMANGQLQETLQALAPFRLPVFLLDTPTACLTLCSRFENQRAMKLDKRNVSGSATGGFQDGLIPWGRLEGRFYPTRSTEHSPSRIP